MVLQRAPQRAIIWGYTDTINTLITLTMNNKTYFTMSTETTTTNSENASMWSVTLDAQTEEGPFQVKVTQPLANRTLDTIILDDVLFGDIWLCSGQSNMGFSVSNMFNASIEIENAYKYPKIRLFTPQYYVNNVPQDEIRYIAMNWSIASNVTVGNPAVSAVCWVYGRMVSEALGGTPIGLIRSAWSGTNIEIWAPPEVLKECDVTVSFYSIYKSEKKTKLSSKTK
jgi:sialate O-acetylesterase